MKREVVVFLLLIGLLATACAGPATVVPTSVPEPTGTPGPMPQPTETAAPMAEATATAEPTEAPMDIVSVAQADGRFSTLLAALQAAGLEETLAGEGPFTVFAPTDDAFAALPEGTVEGLLQDVPALTDILLYHVVEGERPAADLTEAGSSQTVQGQPVIVRDTEDGVKINEAAVVIADIQTDNGVIHVIDAVLLPPDQDLVSLLQSDGRFETLLAALEAADLTETLSGEEPFTVFAPTDDAFAALPEGTVESLLNDVPALTDVLLYHVVPGAVYANEVLELGDAETAQGQPILLAASDGTVMVNDAEVVAADLLADNGVVHVIDSVILPPDRNIAEIAIEDGRFNTLVAALQAADLVETLQGDGPFTVFAPTDDAFAALPEGTVESLLNDVPALTDVLLYHVVDGRVSSADLAGLDSAMTLQGASVEVNGGMEAVMVDDANVIIADILSTNGVIHAIDAVILPPE